MSDTGPVAVLATRDAAERALKRHPGGTITGRPGSWMITGPLPVKRSVERVHRYLLWRPGVTCRQVCAGLEMPWSTAAMALYSLANAGAAVRGGESSNVRWSAVPVEVLPRVSDDPRGPMRQRPLWERVYAILLANGPLRAMDVYFLTTAKRPGPQASGAFKLLEEKGLAVRAGTYRNSSGRLCPVWDATDRPGRVPPQVDLMAIAPRLARAHRDRRAELMLERLESDG